MFIRLLLISVAGYLLFRWVRSHSTQPRQDPPNQLPEAMVKCAHCDIHLPQSRAIGAGDRWFCSPEHRAVHAER